MSCKVMYTCDHCGKEVSPYLGKQWRVTLFTVGPNMDDVHACSKEHLGIALAKTFDIPVDASTLRLVTEKNDALNAARAAILERDDAYARIAELEARMPANECTNAERAQYETTIELQRKWIEELEKRIASASKTEQFADLDSLSKKLVPIFETAYHAGPNNQLLAVRLGIRAVLMALPMSAIQPMTVDGKTTTDIEPDWVVERVRSAIKSSYENLELAKGPSLAVNFRDMAEQAIAELRRIDKERKLLTVDGKTTQGAAEALRRVRERIDSDPYPDVRSLRHIDEELAKLEAKPAQCPPDTSTESGLPDPVIAAITLPTKPTKPLREDDQ